MKIQQYINSVAEENTYLLTSDSGSQLLIDPGSDLQYLSDLIKPDAVLLTHAHFDHIMGLSKVHEKFKEVKIWLSIEEKNWPSQPDDNCSNLLLGQPVLAPAATNYYEIGRDLKISDFTFEVRATPGHSVGGASIIFRQEKVIFSGDALFKNSIGRTDLPTGNFEQLVNSIKNELFSLPDDFKVYPGHGEHTTIGEEKVFNPFL
ncbi:MAG: MBL fold metallo-hydrolase [Streptococcaceae bacterium]|jgi:glyoxylase-like metal-dependent hydrolase (beta-lactamase superfamily II)|nr:MBL fold metallo-hydrolase [Streptococcaceae bacterium]